MVHGKHVGAHPQELLDVSEYECGLATNLFGITEQQFLGLTGPVQCPVG